MDCGSRSRASSVLSHRARTCASTGPGAGRGGVGRDPAQVLPLHVERGDASCPPRSRTVRRKPGSWLTRHIAPTGSSRTSGEPRAPASSAASTRAVLPSLRRICFSDRLASPGITCSRRYGLGSAWGSSRVLMMGRFSVVSRPTSSSKKSARWLSWKGTAGRPFSLPTLPAPANTCRVTRKAVRCATMSPKGTARAIR